MRRNCGFTLVGLVAILTIMGVVAALTMEIKLRLLKQQQIEQTAYAFVAIAQKYDLYYTTNCGTNFVVPALSALGLTQGETSGFVGTGTFSLSSYVTSASTKYLSVKSTYTSKGDAQTVVGLLGRGAKLQSDNRTVEYSFLPSLSTNAQARKNWFGDVNCF